MVYEMSLTARKRRCQTTAALRRTRKAMNSGYWQRRMNRRRILMVSGVTAAGAVGFALVGCGDDDDDNGGASSGSSPTGSAASPTAAAAKPVAGGTYKVLGGPVGGLLDPHR